MKLITLIAIIGAIIANCEAEQFCAACGADGKCTKCWFSILTEEGACIPSFEQVDQCIEYALEGVCQRCRFGYYVDVNGKCVQIPEDGCAIFTVDSGCEACFDGVKIVNGTCTSDQRCNNENCLICSSNGVCMYCKSGYRAVWGLECTLAEGELYNCLASRGPKCTLCDFNTHLVDGKCVNSTAPIVGIGSMLDQEQDQPASHLSPEVNGPTSTNSTDVYPTNNTNASITNDKQKAIDDDKSATLNRICMFGFLFGAFLLAI
jgi:hypothetical protein